MEKRAVYTKWLLAGAALCVAGYFIFNYFYLYESDAFIQANVIGISSLVSGRVERVSVVDLQKVKQSAPLFRIDHEPYDYALSRAQADLEDAQKLRASLLAQVAHLKTQVSTQHNTVAQNLQAWREKKAQHTDRALLSHYYELREAKLRLASAEQNLAAVKAQLGDPNKPFSKVIKAKAALDLARYNLTHTETLAPVNGYVTKMFLRVGEYVKKGESLFAIVDNSTWWVRARFKESALRHLKPGRPVLIWLKSQPSRFYHGIVYGTAWGVNRRQASPDARKSILPYLKQTENWIQLDQRFPVRINITDLDPKHPLHVGATARILLKKS